MTTQTQTMKIKNVLFTIPAPYSEGHILNSAEAKQLNQVFSENVRNNVKKIVDEAHKDLPEGSILGLSETEALRSKVEEYAASYNFSTKAPRTIVDPVEREAIKLAAAAVRSKLREKGQDPSTMDKDAFDALVSKVVAERPYYREEALRRIQAAGQAAQAGLEDLFD